MGFGGHGPQNAGKCFNFDLIFPLSFFGWGGTRETFFWGGGVSSVLGARCMMGTFKLYPLNYFLVHYFIFGGANFQCSSGCPMTIFSIFTK